MRLRVLCSRYASSYTDNPCSAYLFTHRHDHRLASAAHASRRVERGLIVDLRIIRTDLLSRAAVPPSSSPPADPSWPTGRHAARPLPSNRWCSCAPRSRLRSLLAGNLGRLEQHRVGREHGGERVRLRLQHDLGGAALVGERLRVLLGAGDAVDDEGLREVLVLRCTRAENVSAGVAACARGRGGGDGGGWSDGGPDEPHRPTRAHTSDAERPLAVTRLRGCWRGARSRCRTPRRRT